MFQRIERPLQQSRTIEDLRRDLQPIRRSGQTIGLVPTMGALHKGHEALIAQAREDNDAVVVSIFVNPTQFGDAKDLDSYPRTLEADLATCKAAGVDHVFTPDVDQMYAPDEQSVVSVEPLGNDLIGALREGHFRGVATVVTKLFNIVQPTRAYFGKKDFQQLAIIRRMVSDLLIPVEIVGVPTVRDEDGLALSSRNARLTPKSRRASVVLSRALDHGAGLIRNGETSPTVVLEEIRRIIETEPLAALKSLDVRDARFLNEVSAIGNEPVVLLVTAQFGDVLLIDQRDLSRQDGPQGQGSVA